MDDTQPKVAADESSGGKAPTANSVAGKWKPGGRGRPPKSAGGSGPPVKKSATTVASDEDIAVCRQIVGTFLDLADSVVVPIVQTRAKNAGIDNPEETGELCRFNAQERLGLTQQLGALMAQWGAGKFAPYLVIASCGASYSMRVGSAFSATSKPAPKKAQGEKRKDSDNG